MKEKKTISEFTEILKKCIETVGSFNRNKPVYSEKIDLAVSSKKVESGRTEEFYSNGVSKKKQRTRREDQIRK